MPAAAVDDRAAASTLAPACFRTSITSRELPPVVTTSSITTAVSPGSTSNPRRSTIAPFASRSVKMNRAPERRATSWPMIRPADGRGRHHVNIAVRRQPRSRVLTPNCSAMSGCCSTFAHCRYSGLCSPLVSRKWPRRYAPVSLKISSVSFAFSGNRPAYQAVIAGISAAG